MHLSPLPSGLSSKPALQMGQTRISSRTGLIGIVISLPMLRGLSPRGSRPWSQSKTASGDATVRERSSGVLHKIPDEHQVLAQVGLDCLGMGIGFEIRPAREAHVENRVHDGGEIDVAFSEEVRVVF